MIKEKFLKFLLWLKDHFLFHLEVVVRLLIGLSKENKTTTDLDHQVDDQEDDTHD